MGDRTVHVGNLEAFVNEGTLYLLFSQFGTITNVRFAGDPKFNTRYAFVEFADLATAQAACLLDGLAVGSRNIKVGMAKAPGGGIIAQSRPVARGKNMSYDDTERMTRTVHIRGLDAVVSEAYLVQIFSVCAPVTAARISGTSNPRVGWVEFATHEGAIAALGLDGQQLGAHVLRVSASKTAIQTNALAPAMPAAAMQQSQAALALQLQLTSQGIAQALQGTLPAASLPGPPPMRAVRVTGIKDEATEEDVKSYFESGCGKVKKVVFGITVMDTSVGEEKSSGSRERDSSPDSKRRRERERDSDRDRRGDRERDRDGDRDRERGGEDSRGRKEKATQGVRYADVEFETDSALEAALALTDPDILGKAVNSRFQPPPSTLPCTPPAA